MKLLNKRTGKVSVQPADFHEGMEEDTYMVHPYRSLEGKTISEGKEVFIDSVLVNLEMDLKNEGKRWHDFHESFSIAGRRAVRVLERRGKVFIYSIGNQTRAVAKKWCGPIPEKKKVKVDIGVRIATRGFDESEPWDPDY